MTWFKVDDKLHDHRKARAAGCAALGLWTLAGSWSADNLTDGFVPDSICARWDRAYVKLAERLVAVGLWTVAEQDGEQGWRFHQWSTDGRQPTRAQIEKRRAAARERMAKLRDGSREPEANGASSDTEVLEPVPSRPVPIGSSVGEERPVALHASADTKPPDKQGRCTRHPNGNPTNEACGGCRAANELDDKRAARDADKAARAAEQARLNCERCDGTWIVDEQKRPTRRRCDHSRTSVSV